MSLAPTTVVATRRGTVMSNAAPWPEDRRITIRDLQAATDRAEPWSMLTSYDTLTAGLFERAGVRALLVGDTSAEMVLGYGDTLPVTMDQLIPMAPARRTATPEPHPPPGAVPRMTPVRRGEAAARPA
jgi:hypothetical protein